MGEDGAIWRGNHLAHETSPMRSIYGKNGFSSGRERVVKGVRYERGCSVCRAFMEGFFFFFYTIQAATHRNVYFYQKIKGGEARLGPNFWRMPASIPPMYLKPFPSFFLL